MITMAIVASAPAKIILFGEHFVVYGEPAIVMAIDKRAYATVTERDDEKLHIRSSNLNSSGYFHDGIFRIESGDEKETRMKFEPIRLAVEKVLSIDGKKNGFDVEINSTVPIASGLGSSAAVVVAVVMAISSSLHTKIAKEEIFRIGYEAEKLVHGNPSGVDPAVSTFGGTLFFQVDTGFKPLEVKADIPLVIGDTGVKRSTKVQVEKVKELMQRHPRIADLLKKTAREIALGAVDALRENDLETLGELMNINHALLYGIGVSDESVEWLVSAARRGGALGAKLTGAGGGGCMVATAKNEKLENVMAAITKAGGNPFIARKTDDGVRIEHE